MVVQDGAGDPGKNLPLPELSSHRGPGIRVSGTAQGTGGGALWDAKQLDGAHDASAPQRHPSLCLCASLSLVPLFLRPFWVSLSLHISSLSIPASVVIRSSLYHCPAGSPCIGVPFPNTGSHPSAMRQIVCDVAPDLEEPHHFYLWHITLC